MWLTYLSAQHMHQSLLALVATDAGQLLLMHTLKAQVDHTTSVGFSALGRLDVWREPDRTCRITCMGISCPQQMNWPQVLNGNSMEVQ